MPSNSSAPPDAPFTPRREFIREQKQTNAFSLLAIAGSNCIRLYSFPLPVILHLRRFFEQASNIAAYREDISNNFCEFALDGRPWNSPKSTATERLLIEVLAILYQHNYTYLSTIDYGREPDDRLVMTFSKPTGRSESPLPASDHSKSSYSDKSRPKRAPFALSFPSATMLRVVCPPLDSTPAILQAVRGSWPRGVVSEKKVGDNTFEFKLKGYKWFQQDTFAVDSLRHILSLLSSLDTYSFSLLASISLTNRSRVKDLWLFTGPAPSEDVAYPDSPAPSLNASQTDFKRPVYSPDLPPYHPPNSSAISSPHRRLATEPVSTPQHPSPLQHIRAATDEPHRPTGTPMRHASPAHSAPQAHTLRKPAPRAQLPVSVHDDGDVVPSEASYRVQLPSTVPSGIENLTGVGAGGHHEQTPDVFYATSPFHAEPTSPGRSVHDAASGHHSRSPTPKSGRSTPHDKVALVENIAFGGGSPHTEPNTPPLLGPGVFRDSAFSSNTEMSAEIPIKWTGLVADPVPEEAEPTPILPGGWQPTPAEEKEEAVGSELDSHLGQSTQPEQEIQEVVQRVASPTLSEPDMPRKSEAGIIGMVSSANRKGKEKEGSNHGQGWVMVNVEASPPAAAESKDASAPVEDVANSQSSDKGSSSLKTADGEDSTRQQSFPKASMSPAAKAIVIIDAVDQKHKKSKSEQVQSPSRIRRFFSMSRKDPKRPSSVNDSESTISSKSKSRSSLNKLKNGASQNTSRRSIDG